MDSSQYIDYEALVQDAIAALPERIRKNLQDTIIVIEDRPRLRRTGAKSLLLGLYEGLPLTAWGRDYSGKQPDKITIYRGNIELYASSPADIPAIVRETVWHEIGHHFGLDHNRIGKMEQRWRMKRKK